MKAVALMVLALVCAGIAPSAYSQIVKCRAESGQLVYTEEKCPPGTQPLDLDKSLPASVRTAPAQVSAAASEPVLSPRAQELKPFIFACAYSANTECNEFRQMYRPCMDKRNRDAADCKALVELLPLAERARMRKIMQEQRQRCREQGSMDQCKRAACPMLSDHEAEDEQLYACSHAWGLPSTRLW